MASQRRRDPLRSQVEAESLVKYGPEGSALNAMLKELVADRDQGIAVAESTSRGLTNAVTTAAPRVKLAGDITKMELGGSRNRLAEALSALSSGADPIKAASLRDFAGADARLGMEVGRSQQELEARKLDAASGRLSATSAAQSAYQSDRAKIQDRALDLARESGAFAQGRYGDLKEGQRGRTFKARESARDRSARAREGAADRSATATQKAADRASREGIAATRGTAGAKAKKWAPTAQQGAAADKINTAIREAKVLKAGGASRSEVAQLLAAGAKDQSRPVYDSTGKKVLNSDGTQKVRQIPGLPKIEQQEYLTAGLDVVFDRHLSRRTQRLLHGRGIKIKPLGLPTYQQWKRTQTSPYDTPAARTGGN